MERILPVIVVCSIGLAICSGLLIFYFVRYLLRRFRRREEFELDENKLVVHLDKKHHRQ